jgi:hypothetical protein
LLFAANVEKEENVLPCVWTWQAVRVVTKTKSKRWKFAVANLGKHRKLMRHFLGWTENRLLLFPLSAVVERLWPTSAASPPCSLE